MAINGSVTVLCTEPRINTTAISNVTDKGSVHIVVENMSINTTNSAHSRISIGAGVLIPTTGGGSGVTAAIDLISADKDNIISIGTDEKLFAAPVELTEANFLASYLLAKG